MSRPCASVRESFDPAKGRSAFIPVRAAMDISSANQLAVKKMGQLGD